MKKWISFLLLALLVTGCKTGWINPSKMNKLSVGMGRADVVKVLGIPHHTEAREGVETLWYLEDQGAWIHKPYFVRIVSGKVDAYGPGR